ncbi:MAG TPA: hypothetical protein VF766_00470 [Pyrinomonadaceae bacterium]
MALKKKTWFYIIGGLLAIGIVGAIMEKQKPQSDSPTAASQSSTAPVSSNATTNVPAPIPVTATALYQDYEANEVAADEKYKGKTLAVSGTVDSIGKDITDTMYVTLNSGKQYSITNVQCMFDDEHKNALSRLSKGQKITIKGRCDGKLGNVFLKDCVLQ